MSYETNQTLDSIFGVKINKINREKFEITQFEFERYKIKSVLTLYSNHRHTSLILTSQKLKDEK